LRLDHHGEGQVERQRRVEQAGCAAGIVPLRGAFVLGVDQQRHTADFMRHGHAAHGGTQEQAAAEAATLHAAIDGEEAKSKDGHVVAVEPSRGDGRHTGEFDAGGARGFVDPRFAMRRVDLKWTEPGQVEPSPLLLQTDCPVVRAAYEYATSKTE